MQCSTPAVASLPANAMIKNNSACNSYFGGPGCEIHCRPGFIGATTFTCSASGAWTGSLTCIPCPYGQFQAQAGQSFCQSWNLCSYGSTFEAAAPTSSSDRVCQPITPACDVYSYEIVPPTLTSDRQCAQLTQCGFRQYESVHSPLNADRECADCTVCGTGKTAQAGSCNGVIDSVCVPCKACNQFQYETSPCSSFSDRVCATVSSCPLGFTELTAPTASSDRTCKQTVSRINDAPPSNQVYVSGEMHLANVPNAFSASLQTVSDEFLTVFTSTVVAYFSKFASGRLSVTVFSARNAGARRRDVADVIVTYRVEVSASGVSDTQVLITAAGNTNAFTAQLRTVAPLVAVADYSRVAASSTSVKPSTQGQAQGSSSSSSSSTDKAGIAVAVVVSVVGFIILVVVIVHYFRRSPTRGDADLSASAMNNTFAEDQ